MTDRYQPYKTTRGVEEAPDWWDNPGYISAPVVAEPAPEDVLSKWQQIWKETRGMTQPGGTALEEPQWWETEDGYVAVSKVDQEQVDPWTPTVESQFGIAGPTAPPDIDTSPVSGASSADLILAGLWDRVEQTGEIISNVAGDMGFGEGNVVKAGWNLIKTLFIPRLPIVEKPGEDEEPRAIVPKAMLYLPQEWTRKVVGFIANQNLFDIRSHELHPSLHYHLLATGQFERAITEATDNPLLTDEERARDISEAAREQAAYTQYLESARRSGMDTKQAQKAALREFLRARGEFDIGRRESSVLLRALKQAQEDFPEAAEAYARGERSFPWSATAEEQWKFAQGYRYSHSWKPDLARAYENLVDVGWDPEEAGAATEDPTFESLLMTILDPNWAIGLDDVVMKAAWGGAKTVGKGLGKVLTTVGMKVPIKPINVLTTHLMTISAKTSGNYLARNVDDIVRKAARYLSDAGEEVTAEAIERVLRTPPEDFLMNMPRYFRRAWEGVQPVLDDVAGAMKRVFGEAALEKALVDVGDEVVRRRIVKELFEEGVENASGLVYRTAIEEAVEKDPVLRSAFVKWAKGSLPYRFLTEFNSVAVDTWLGVRPSWNVFNMIDNAVKLVLDGINPVTSVPGMLDRYAKYTAEFLGAGDDVRKLRDIPFWDFARKAKSDEYVEILRRNLPRQVTGAFASGIRKTKTGFRKYGLTEGTLGRAADWNYALGERIEMTFRSRAYLHNFFEYIDDRWDIMSKRPAVLRVGNVNYAVSEEVANYLAARFGSVSEPTPEFVQSVFDDLLRTDRVTFISSNLGLGIEDTLHYVDQDVVKKGQRDLWDLVRHGDDGPVTTKQAIREQFERIRNEIRLRNQEEIATGIRAFDDMLPELPETADEMYEILVHGVPEPAMEDLFRAVDEMPLMAHRFDLEWEKATKEFWEKDIAEAVAAGKSKAETGLMKDEFFERRIREWTAFTDKQQSVLTRVADQIDDLQRVKWGAEAEAHLFPREEIFDQYLYKLDQLQYLEARMRQLRRQYGILTGKGHYSEAKLADRQAHKLWSVQHPQLEADIHDVEVAWREWFQTEGLNITDPLELDELARGAGWWRQRQQIRDIKMAAEARLTNQLAEVQRWEDAVMMLRVRPYRVVSLSPMDRRILEHYGPRMVDDTRELISDAMDTAIQKTNDLLFDYETTPNWMNFFGNLVPFVRFPIKNLPLWASKFAEVPHMFMTVSMIRRIHASINRQRGVPTRHQYSVSIPRVLTNWLLEPLGFHNTQLRFNPWSYISLFQQVPGGTPYRRQELAELYTDTEDQNYKWGIEAVTTLMQQSGFGLWPWIEYALGANGLLGDDWYPRGVFSTWAPTVNWALRSVFGYRQNYDIDVVMRKRLPQFWNVVFGGGPLAWEEMNPDLLQSWATGREEEFYIMEIPEEAAAALAESGVTPASAWDMLQRLKAGEVPSEEDPERFLSYLEVQQQVLPVFQLPVAQQVAAVRNMTASQIAVFWEEVEKAATRRAIQKAAFTTIAGNLFGAYLEPANLAEVEAREVRYQKRLQKELLDVGPEQRDFERQFREEHPKYGLIQSFRFGQFPWATTAAGKEAEIWDSMIQDAESEYWDWRSQFDDKRDEAIASFYQQHPGDKHGLSALKNQLRIEREEKEDYFNERLMTFLRKRMEVYIREHPRDRKGIDKLRGGFETEVYVGTHLTPEQRERLRQFRDANPSDEDGLERLFAQLWEEAQRLNPPTAMKRWPGLDAGFEMNLKWNPSSYSEEEVRQRLIGDVFRELSDKAPDREEYENGAAWYGAFAEWKESLPSEALKLTEVQKQVRVLMQNSGLSRQEAESVVKSWYTEDEYDDYWREFRTPWEALEDVYQTRWIAGFDDEWFGPILELKKEYEDAEPGSPERSEKYALYAAAREELFGRSGPIPATEMIPYIMDVYAGKWTLSELDTLFSGLIMPSYQMRRVLREQGEDALNAYVWYYYNRLPGEARRLVRSKFGEPFTKLFLNDRSNEVSPELRGDWITALSGMLDERIDWRRLPGIDNLLENEKGGKRAAQEFGLPKIAPSEQAEFERAVALERQYWQFKAVGDPRADALEDNPLRVKWFNTNTGKGYFWAYYYDNVPPGWVSKELKDHPAVKIVLDRDVRYSVAEDSDYDRAITVMEDWLRENADTLRDYGMDPSEYERVRQLINTYYDIPKENKAERRAFRDANPLLTKYLYKPDSSYGGRRSGGGGRRGGGGGGSRIDYDTIWTAFQARVGVSQNTVLRMLSAYWTTGTFTGEQAEAYLRQLHNEIGGELGFEVWLEALRRAWEYRRGSKTGGGQRASSTPRSAPTPRYSTRITGQRRL